MRTLIVLGLLGAAALPVEAGCTLSTLAGVPQQSYGVVQQQTYGGTCSTCAPDQLPVQQVYQQPVYQQPAYDVGALCQQACVAAQVPVASYAVQRSVVAAPVYHSYYQQPAAAFVQRSAVVYHQPVVQQQVIVRQRAFVPSYGYGSSAQVFRSPAFVGPPIQRGFGGGGFGGGRFNGPIAQGFQTGGLLGAAERFTGLGNGSGDFGRGAIIGVLGARSNLFGLGRR